LHSSKPTHFFCNVAAVIAEFRRVSELRELLRVEEIIIKLEEITMTNTRSPGKGAALELERLIARACDGILLLQQGCVEQGLTLDFDEIERQRRFSLPDSHPYKVLLAYMDSVGVERFSDFGRYTEFSVNHECQCSSSYLLGNDHSGQQTELCLAPSPILRGRKF
jgi:hypothetical protein